jgi:MarR family transcriptional regulator, temperature-dependent positive regulator of motility
VAQLNQEVHLKVLRHLESDPEITQRALAKQLGISLGKVNYCLKALIDKGLIKTGNFKNSSNKSAYLYLLTPKGIEEKSRITIHFLKRKIGEYENLRREINELQQEIQANGANCKTEKSEKVML